MKMLILSLNKLKTIAKNRAIKVRVIKVCLKVIFKHA